jgi:class III poly(R)-hydroxyalkanoic acid synthase PhaE subunit
MDRSEGSNGFPWSEWMESAASLWLSAAQSWQELSTSLAGCSRTEEYMQASLSIWRAFVLPWTQVQGPEAKESQQPSFDMIQAIMQVMGPGGLSQEIFKWLWNKGEVTGHGFEKFQHEAVKAWTAIHEKGIQPLLKIPQVGLTRVHQEEINRLADKFNGYQGAVSEFQMLLSFPMEKSFADLKEELDRLREKGEPAEDFKVYYGMWIKILENHYMSLFRSQEYRLALSRLLNETAAFRITGNDVLMEFLEFLPIPTNKEMDELYKELYSLKKQTKEAAKKISKMESALAKKDIQ